MKKYLLALILIVSPLATAQTLPATDVGVWISDSEYNDPSITDEEGTLDAEVDENVGFGVSLNHFWLDSFSTELAYHQFGGDVDASFDGSPRFDAGEIDTQTLTAIAQWHFRRASRFSPYVGAGAAFVTGEVDPGDGDVTVDLEDEFTWAANFGANIALNEHWSIGLDAKFINWEPKAENDDASERVDLSPAVLSAGLKFRF